MPFLDYQTAGESHGPGVLITITGLPAGMRLDTDLVNVELRRRQGGYGRGARQRIERDSAEVLSGIYRGKTIGSPLALLIRNRDARLEDLEKTPPIFTPRPGHADLAGALKYLTPDCRPVLERASARETAGRTGAGAVAGQLLRRATLESGPINVFGFVRAIGGEATDLVVDPQRAPELWKARDASETYCPDPAATKRQVAAIRAAKIDKDTLGGLLECHVFNLPPGLGSTMDWRDKLDARIAFAVMSIQAIKGVEIGDGFSAAAARGSNFHDPIAFDPAKVESPSLGFVRSSNHAGGTEGGMSNGQTLVVRAAMKPISTLLDPLPSVDLRTGEPHPAAYERSDICAAPAASVVMQNVVAFEVARAFLAKFGGDTLDEVRWAYEAWLTAARKLGKP
ncbi:MAG: chorismate synthase [Phycisphaerales bacterium]|nr:chorismate synthase [Phycisphaerales bacterium]